MIARVLWFAALVVIGAVTAQLQLDRESARKPEVGTMIATPFRSYAQDAVTREALQGDDPQRALAEARRLVLRRPIPAEHLALLAQAHVKADQTERAPPLITNAALRGWREPWVQDGMARLALASGDIPEATRRFIALMLQGNNNDTLLRELAEEIFAEPASPGYPTMVEIVTGTDRWFAWFIRRGPEVMPPAAFAEVLLASLAAGSHVECAALTNPIQLVSRSDEAVGRRLVAALDTRCPELVRQLQPRRG